jgi:hypothetical protein
MAPLDKAIAVVGKNCDRSFDVGFMKSIPVSNWHNS